MKQAVSCLAALLLTAANAEIRGETEVFDGPMGGKYYARTSETQMNYANIDCLLSTLKTCNAITDHTEIWCYAKFDFENCESIEAMDEYCEEIDNRGECD
jgi:hypothetical protein